jgi:hypothetical protein
MRNVVERGVDHRDNAPALSRAACVRSRRAAERAARRPTAAGTGASATTSDPTRERSLPAARACGGSLCSRRCRATWLGQRLRSGRTSREPPLPPSRVRPERRTGDPRAASDVDRRRFGGRQRTRGGDCCHRAPQGQARSARGRLRRAARISKGRLGQLGPRARRAAQRFWRARAISSPILGA